jgi:hypothetical protein
VTHETPMGRQTLVWRPIVRFAVGVFALAAVACKSMGPPGPPLPHHERDLLTREEILSSTAQQGDLLQAIHSLRPNFLSARGRAPLTGLVVYVNRIRQTGGLEALQSIAATKVAEVRYLEPTAALNEFGPVAGGGALVVTLFDPSREPIGVS